MMDPGIGVFIRRKIFRRVTKKFVAFGVDRFGMEERLPVSLGVLELALTHHFHQLLRRVGIHVRVALLRQGDGRHGQELLMAGDAVLATGMAQESLL